MIQGGSRSVGFYDPIILELIPEIGYTSSLASSWSCSPSPCFSPFSPGIQVVDKTMYVSSGQLSPGLYVFRITVAHQILQTSLTDEISIHIMRYPMNEISAFIFSRTFGKISSDKMLSLDGSLSTANKNDPALLWSQIVGDNLFGMSDNSTYTNLDVSSIQVPFIAFFNTSNDSKPNVRLQIESVFSERLLCVCRHFFFDK